MAASPSPPQPEPVPDSFRLTAPWGPLGYYQHLINLFTGVATTNLARDPDDPYDPDEDAPWTVVQTIELKTADQAAEEAAARFIREDYLQDPGSDGEIYSAGDMITAFLAGADWATFNRDI